MKTKKTFLSAIYITIFISFITINPNGVLGQNINLQSVKNFGGSTGGSLYNYDAGSGLAKTPDGGYILIGSTTSLDGDATGGGYHFNDSGTTDVWVIKLDSSQNIMWQHSYGGTDNDDGKTIIVSSNGNYVFTAITSSVDGDVTSNHGSSDLWVVEIDSSGNIVWQKCFGGSLAESNSVGTTITESLDGSYYISCTTSSADGDIIGYNGGSSDGWVIKVDITGNIVWQLPVGGNTTADVIQSIAETSDSGCIITGYRISNKINPTGSLDVYVIKISKTGSISWAKPYGGPDSDFGWSVKQIPNGNYVICASTRGNIPGYNGGLYDVFILMLDSSGGVIWQKPFGGSSSEYAYSLCITSSGDIIVIGGTSSSDGDVLGGNFQGYIDIWIMEIDFLGNLITQRCVGGNHIDIGLFVIEVKANTFMLIGQTSSSNSGDIGLNHLANVPDLLIVKFTDLSPSSSLPINLLSFKAKKMKDKVELSWKTSSEINNNYFTIEKSIDGYMYQEIGRVSGAGNSSQILNYSFFDDNPFRGVTYYRLSQTDYNGESETFPVVAIEFNDSKPVVKTILYNIQGLEVEDNDYLDSGIYFRISYDMDGNIIGQNKFFK